MRHIIYMFAFFASVSVFAQTETNADTINTDFSRTQAIAQEYQAKFSALKDSFTEWEYTGGDTLANPYYFRLFSAQTRYDQPLRSTIGSLNPSKDITSPRFGRERRIEAEIARILSDTYTNAPSLISYVEDKEGENDGLRTDVNREIIVSTPLAKGLTGDATIRNLGNFIPDEDVQVVIYKPNFWNFSSNFSLQFMQYYVTDNWYKGGESNNSLLASLVVNANYNNKQKITFENKLEMKLGFQTTKVNDGQQYKTNADLLRLTNKLGLRASKHWYYTAMLQSWTQFYKSFDGNRMVTSDFMSPFESVFSVGMEYKLDKEKFSIKAVMSPVACNVKYVDRIALAERFGLEKNKHVKVDIGSTVTFNYNWQICKQIRWEGRVYYFTNYHKSQIDWENTFHLAINKYLSTKLFLNPRFDDSINRKDGESNFEFNEWLSVGLNLDF